MRLSVDVPGSSENSKEFAWAQCPARNPFRIARPHRHHHAPICTDHHLTTDHCPNSATGRKVTDKAKPRTLATSSQAFSKPPFRLRLLVHRRPALLHSVLLSLCAMENETSNVQQISKQKNLSQLRKDAMLVPVTHHRRTNY